MRDAAARAQLYADALALGKVRPVAIADAGMLGAHSESASLRAVAAAPGGGGGNVELVPEDIRVSVSVDARFVAG